MGLIINTFIMTSKEYVIALLKTPPPELYAGQICMLMIGIGISLWLFGIKKGIKASALLLFVFYGLYMICITVVYRHQLSESRMNLIPLWSYKAIMNGKILLIKEIIMNIVAFIPIGVMIPIFYKKALWWQIVLVGSMVSVSVELLQYYYKRGLCEFDDVFHNTLGSLIGYGLFLLTTLVVRRFISKH